MKTHNISLVKHNREIKKNKPNKATPNISTVNFISKEAEKIIITPKLAIAKNKIKPTQNNIINQLIIQLKQKDTLIEQKDSELKKAQANLILLEGLEKARKNSSSASKPREIRCLSTSRPKLKSDSHRSNDIKSLRSNCHGKPNMTKVENITSIQESSTSRKISFNNSTVNSTFKNFNIYKRLKTSQHLKKLFFNASLSTRHKNNEIKSPINIKLSKNSRPGVLYLNTEECTSTGTHNNLRLDRLDQNDVILNLKKISEKTNSLLAKYSALFKKHSVV